MTWSNPTDAVAALKTMMLACASILEADAAFHYPSAALGADSGGGSQDSIPLWLLAETDTQRTPYAEAGTIGLPSGTLAATYYKDADAGTIEKYARTIAGELSAIVGLPNPQVSVQMCSDPSPGALAVDEQGATGTTNAKHRAITLIIQYGLG